MVSISVIYSTSTGISIAEKADFVFLYKVWQEAQPDPNTFAERILFLISGQEDFFFFPKLNSIIVNYLQIIFVSIYTIRNCIALKK